VLDGRRMFRQIRAYDHTHIGGSKRVLEAEQKPTLFDHKVEGKGSHVQANTGDSSEL
jgi:hypothetical protein